MVIPRQRTSDDLTAAVVAERFPTYRDTLHEAVRKPRPIRPAGGDPDAMVDNDIACKKRRDILNDALDGVHHDLARTA